MVRDTESGERRERPDLADLLPRIRRATWHALLAAALTLLLAIAVLRNSDQHLPVWVLLAPPALLVLGAAYLWVLGRYLARRAGNPPQPGA